MKKSILFLACAIVVALLSACGGGASTPADAALKCAELFKNGDFEALVDELSFPEGTTDEEKEQTKAMILAMGKEKAQKETEKRGGITSYEIASEEIAEDGKTAVVKIKYIYGDGSDNIQKYDLALVDGTWKPIMKK